jgi:hypothetical protein
MATSAMPSLTFGYGGEPPAAVWGLTLVRPWQVEPSSFRHTLKLLPVGKKAKQKFVCGDDSGGIACYEMKRGEQVWWVGAWRAAGRMRMIMIPATGDDGYNGDDDDQR